MDRFITVEGKAAPLPMANVDTDVIMPKTFLKGIDRAGLDIGVFNLLRFAEGRPRSGFVLNRAGYEDARFLVVGPNFGCGSSREHAVWGLSQLGFRALIGTSFAGIFDDNCRNNGVLTITLDPGTVDHIVAVISDPASNGIRIDLEKQVISLLAVQEDIPFEVDALRKQALMLGLDAIGVTLSDVDAILAFESRHRQENPWLF